MDMNAERGQPGEPGEEAFAGTGGRGGAGGEGGSGDPTGRGGRGGKGGPGGSGADQITYRERIGSLGTPWIWLERAGAAAALVLLYLRLATGT
jgi:hypothetical protein